MQCAIHAAPVKLCLGGNIMSDSRDATLRAQLIKASIAHRQMTTALSPAQRDAIRSFERQVYVVQVVDRAGGSLQSGGALLAVVDSRNATVEIQLAKRPASR